MMLGRRLAAVEARMATRQTSAPPRLAVLHGDGDARIAWVGTSRNAILVLPHNGRDLLPGGDGIRHSGRQAPDLAARASRPRNSSHSSTISGGR